MVKSNEIKKHLSYSRYHHLYSEFKLNNASHSFLCYEMKESIERIFHYVYNSTKINSIFEMNENILIQYLLTNRWKNFNIISFVQVIKDIKSFSHFFDVHYGGTKRTPIMNFSLLNFSLWEMLK